MMTVDAATLIWTDGSDSDLVSMTEYDATGRVARTIENYVDGVVAVTEPITDRITILTYDGLGRLTQE